MYAYNHFPAQNNQWYNKARSYRKRKYRSTTVPRSERAMLVIDGAYFEQGTHKFFMDNYEVNFQTKILNSLHRSRPNHRTSLASCDAETLISSFINSIEEMLNVTCIHRHFYTALFQRSQAYDSMYQKQSAIIQIMEDKCGFIADCRDFKNMSIYCPNNRCKHNNYPINRRVQAEVDVAIATKSLSMAAKDEYDVLIVITGDRDFKDCFKSVSSDFGKSVKIVGFEGSTWNEYYDRFRGIEVISAERVWGKAIGFSLFSKDLNSISRSTISENRRTKGQNYEEFKRKTTKSCTRENQHAPKQMNNERKDDGGVNPFKTPLKSNSKNSS